ncbi:MAG: HAD family phosphatase [Rhodothermales bacterium]
MNDQIKAILWDNDGVLVDTEHIYFRVTQSVLQEAGVSIDERDYRKHFLTGSAGAWHLAVELGFTDDQIEEMRQRRNDLYADALRSEEVAIDGAQEVLEELKSNYRMAVVTSSRRRHFEIIHERTGFLPYFEFVLVREDYVRSKPDPEPYLTAAEKLGLPPEACLAIEDSERGLRAAASAGMRCWVIPTDLTRGGDLSAAERILASISDLPGLLSVERRAV